MVSSLIDRDTRRWKVDLVKSIFFPFKANTILNIPLYYNLPEDKIIWVGNRKGKFTVKSVYYIALKVIEAEDEGESSTGDGRNALWKRLWHFKISAKTKIFTWKAYMDGLPTTVNLKKRGVDIDELCLCYERGPKSISHSLITCNIARRVWDYWLDCPVEIPSSPLDFSDLAMEILAQGTSHDLELFFVTAWSIWYNRNQVVQESANQSPQSNLELCQKVFIGL
nr:uncharacterized protein LOC112016041 [Quercus suber]POE45494.1 hypothetical protein CFP56_26688 [Quercus suber]